MCSFIDSNNFQKKVSREISPKTCGCLESQLVVFSVKRRGKLENKEKTNFNRN